MPGVITSRAVAREASKLPLASPLQTMSRSVTMPISRSFSPIGMAPTSCLHINFARSVTGVSGPTQSTPLCITSLTFNGWTSVIGVDYANAPLLDRTGDSGSTTIGKAARVDVIGDYFLVLARLALERDRFAV